MLNEQGRYISGRITEQGRYAYSVDEAGRRSWPVVATVPHVAAVLAHAVDTLPPVKGTLTSPLAVPISAIQSFVTSSCMMAGLAHALDMLPAIKGASTIPFAVPVLALQSAAYDSAPPVCGLWSGNIDLQPDYVTGGLMLPISHRTPLRASFCAVMEASAPARALLASPVFSAEPVRACYGGPLAMPDNNSLSTVQSAPLDAGPPSVTFPAPVYTVFTGGNNINKLIGDVEIRQDIDAPHASFKFASISKVLFDALTSRDRLTITINSVPREFVIEEIGMIGEIAFNVWGRSASCLLDSPHHGAVTIEADGTQTAAGLAAALTGLTVWDAVDYPLPDGWSMTGTPMEIVIRLAATVRAVVQPDGLGIKVMQRYPVRPVEWPSSTPAAVYTREANILSLSWDDEGKTAWNSVEVNGHGMPWNAPILELEEQGPAPGDPVHVRIFRKGVAEAFLKNMVTDGAVVSVGQNISQVIQKETVQFSGYRGSTRYPVYELLSFTWVGDSRGDIYWLAGGRSQELELAPGSYPDLEGCGLAEITYRTSYDRYLLYGHYVPELMLICANAADETVRVRLLVDGRREPAAPAIIEELATTEAAAVAAGTAWLDANRYNERKVAVSAPHDTAVVPGTVVSLADEVEDVSGAGMVLSKTINISGPSVIDSLEVVQCLS